MTEPTPRQLRTDQLLEQAKEGYREINENLQFLRKGAELGGVVDVQALIVLIEIAVDQQRVNHRLLQAIENMAGAPCFDKQGA